MRELCNKGIIEPLPQRFLNWRLIRLKVTIEAWQLLWDRPSVAKMSITSRVFDRNLVEGRRRFTRGDKHEIEQRVEAGELPPVYVYPEPGEAH